MQSIIVPLDGSELSERALGLAEVFARSYGASIDLIHVLEDPIAFDLMPSGIVVNRADVEQYLQRVADRMPDDIPVMSAVIRGEPVKEILKLAQRTKAAMLVMATHGRGGPGRLMFGSVADKVLRGSVVPVALVRGTGEPRHYALTSLLVPLDNSSFAEGALPVAMDLARRSGATVGLLRVCEPFWSSPSAVAAPELAFVSSAQITGLEQSCVDDARRYLETIATQRRAEGIHVDWEVRSGKPADEIIRAAETTGTDLIVISTHGRGGLRRLALGSVTNEVLHRGTTPILALPPRAMQQEAEHEREREQIALAELLSTT